MSNGCFTLHNLQLPVQLLEVEDAVIPRALRATESGGSGST